MPSNAAPPVVLIAEDDSSLRDLMSEILGSHYRVVTAASGTEAILRIKEHAPDLVLSDIKMPGASGMDVLRFALSHDPPARVVLVTAFGTIEQAVEAMQLGASDYLTKPLKSPALLRATVKRALAGAPDRVGMRVQRADEALVYEDPRSLQTLRLIDRVAPTQATVLLQGPTGAGKEGLARRLHAKSARADGPFIAVNCGAIPPSLVESFFFGHVRGAFTGADDERQGAFDAADGGTLFLDEIGELSESAQTSLLRVLETGHVTRVGELREHPVDVRVVAATHRTELGRGTGAFRQDLYYRISQFPVQVAPLRERPDDILPIARRLLTQHGHGARRLSAASERVLLRHRWPGNVRELRNVVERAVILAEGVVIEPEHLGLEVRESRPRPASSATLESVEKRAILAALERTGGHRRKTAEALGISLRALQYKLKAYGLTRGSKGRCLGEAQEHRDDAQKPRTQTSR